MADALVALLNGYGYQPIFLPRTGLKPPDLYTYIRRQGHLIRRGSLLRYLPDHPTLEPLNGKLANIEHKQTSGKDIGAAVSFLESALRCIGIENVPKLDLRFTGGIHLRRDIP
jgi:hypothetical protein